ncbi:MAG: hypothetical protein A3G30_04330 [Chlamydiae bacterium RIFCSPLOWO2_12_FULL_49_12]|nr:MAG: hypothetical protein A3G30_04330 [Chlamydiae bacterium RIFCSPLOWO2_12_FULL_49_12]
MHPYSWIQTVTGALAEAGSIPLLGFPPPFPWKAFEEALKEKFACDSVVISCDPPSFREKESLLEGLGASPLVVPLHLTPLSSSFYWAMGMEDVKRLTTALLTRSKEQKGFTDDRFASGYYRYLLLEVLETLHHLKPFEELFLKLAPESPLPHEEALCVDVDISINSCTSFGRLIVPLPFLSSFKKRFSQKKAKIPSKEIASSLYLTLSIDLGSTTIPSSRWASLSEGDLIILERCNYDPAERKGTVEISLGKTPLFQARLKEHTLKILDYSFYYEEESLMEESETEEEKEPPEEESLEEEELKEEQESPEHLWSAEKGEAPLEKLMAASDVPLTLTVEAGRLEMSLEKVMELRPGNTLELKTRPEDLLDVTLNGKRIAKAELVKIGSVLGIKILSLG